MEMCAAIDKTEIDSIKLSIPIRSIRFLFEIPTCKM